MKTDNDSSFELLHGSALQMREVASESVALAFTSLPFFSSEIEAVLREPVSEQTSFDDVGAAVVAFAHGFRPAFTELDRVLMPGGHLVLETKDLRYARRLISLSCIHRSMAESAGLHLVTRLLWQNTAEAPHHGATRRRLGSLEKSGEFRVVDTEEFLVFLKPGGQERSGQDSELETTELGEIVSPLWTLPPTRSWHPHPSPREVVRRMILLLSSPGDIVLDPFAGAATILRTASALGRRAVGYEIDREYWARSVSEAL